MNASLIFHNLFDRCARMLRRVLGERGRVVLCVCSVGWLCGVPVAVYAGEQRDPWGLVESMPGDIDVVAVLDEPAGKLLSDPGKASRSLLGGLPIFSKTRRAWGSLGALFETDAEGVIERLLSGRVVLVVDGVFGQSGNPLTMMTAADSNWAVMAEVGEDSFAELRRKLKPVPREIVLGVPVYGIEQGRYALVMLTGIDGGPGRVMLSPKGGRGLLERMLGSVQALEKGGGKNAELGSSMPRWDHDGAWLMAVRVRVDAWSAGIDRTLGIEGDGQHAGSRYVRAMMGATDGAGCKGMVMSLAMPIGGEITPGRAPVGLLGALDADIVMAMASSSLMRVVVDQEEGLSFLTGDVGDRRGTVLVPEGSLFVMTREDTARLSDGNGALGMTMLALFGEDVVDAVGMDALIEPLVCQDPAASDGLFPEVIDQADHPRRSYGGMFPGAIRTQSVFDEQGERTMVSWKTTKRGGSSDLILSLGEGEADTADRVRMLDGVAGSLDAVGGAPVVSPVVLSGFVRLGALLDSMDQWKWVWGNASVGIDADGLGRGMVRWEVVQDRGALRGELRIEEGRE